MKGNNMKCFVCGVEIEPYQPGTLLNSELGAAHEDCFKLYREDYKTADEIIAEAEDEERR